MPEVATDVRALNKPMAVNMNHHLRASFLLLLLAMFMLPVSQAYGDWTPWNSAGESPWDTGDTPVAGPKFTQEELDFIEEYLADPQSNEGYLSDQVYGSDPESQNLGSFSITNAQLEMPPDDALGLGTGVGGLFSKGNQIYTLPLSYNVWDRITLDLQIPLVRKELTVEGRKGVATGLGDIPVHVQYLLDLKTINLHFSAMIKTPTGNTRAEDDGIVVPLGTGSVDFNTVAALGLKMDHHKFNALMSGRWNTRGKYGRFEYTRGSMFQYSTGYAYGFFSGWLDAGVSLTGLVKGRSEFEANGETYLSKDSLSTLDLSMGISYVGFYIEIISPLLTVTDPEAENPDSRDVGTHIGYQRLF